MTTSDVSTESETCFIQEHPVSIPVRKEITMETVNGGVIHSYPKVGVAAVILEEHLAQGDRIHIRGLHDDVHPSVTSREIEPVPVKEADRGQGIGIRVIERICGVIWCSAGAEGFFFFKKVY